MKLAEMRSTKSAKIDAHIDELDSSIGQFISYDVQECFGTERPSVWAAFTSTRFDRQQSQSKN